MARCCNLLGLSLTHRQILQSNRTLYKINIYIYSLCFNYLTIARAKARRSKPAQQNSIPSSHIFQISFHVAQLRTTSVSLFYIFRSYICAGILVCFRLIQCLVYTFTFALYQNSNGTHKINVVYRLTPSCSENFYIVNIHNSVFFFFSDYLVRAKQVL